MLVAINAILSLRAAQYLLLGTTTALIVFSLYAGIRIRVLAIELKSAKADLAWVQGALKLQNDAIQKAGEDQKKLEEQQKVKAAEAAQAKATAAERAAEIMRLKLSTDCKEVARWGIEQASSQSHW